MIHKNHFNYSLKTLEVHKVLSFSLVTKFQHLLISAQYDATISGKSVIHRSVNVTKYLNVCEIKTDNDAYLIKT